MRPNRLLMALVAAALLLAACGDDDSGAATGSNEYSKALAESLAQDDQMPFDQAQVDCLSQEFVGALGGPDALKAADITPDELRESDDISSLGLDRDAIDGDAIAASFGNCDVSLTELILSEAGDQVPDDVRACVSDALDEEALADFFAQTIISGDSSSSDLPPDIMKALMGCFQS